MPAIAGKCRRLPANAGDCRQMPATAGKCRRLPAIAGKCRWLYGLNETKSFRHVFKTIGSSAIIIMTTLNEQQILKDEDVVQYLLKNEDIIINCFDVPHDQSPTKFLLCLANEACCQRTRKYSKLYSVSLYSSIRMECTFCTKNLKIKKKLTLQLFDDIFGTNNIIVLTKYCKFCKLTYYPGYAEHYEAKVHYYDTDWKIYGIFISTHCTAFSNDFLNR